MAYKLMVRTNLISMQHWFAIFFLLLLYLILKSFIALHFIACLDSFIFQCASIVCLRWIEIAFFVYMCLFHLFILFVIWISMPIEMFNCGDIYQFQYCFKIDCEWKIRVKFDQKTTKFNAMSESAPNRPQTATFSTMRFICISSSLWCN